MSINSTISRLLKLSLAVFFCLGLACSDRTLPTDPFNDDQGSPLFAQQEGTAFQQLLEASDHENYTTLSSTIGGFSGGTVSGTVSGYQSAFSVTVPNQSFSGSRDITMMVPTDAVPVYQLLPHGTFTTPVTVVLDYYFWITEGTIEHGDSCEVYFMNEVTEEFDVLSPRAIFVADSLNANISFTTSHFSNWAVKDKTED